MDMGPDLHRELGAALNGEVWSLLEKPDRTQAEDMRMIHAAHASQYHWLVGGDEANEQRGEWLIARVYLVLGHPEAALRHARRCMELTERHPGKMQDFDLAFAYEGLARTSALAGDSEEAARLKAKARELGSRIADPEDRQIFEQDFASGQWFGVDGQTSSGTT
ncbi:tetratricopeptide repeat protein [Candidatus Fermentibacterales bacterium]|nr:tetratricopeptide repeat protein [Candidatus Fermentibacterales bacterium]